MCFAMIPSIAAVVFQVFLSWVNAFFFSLSIYLLEPYHMIAMSLCKPSTSAALFQPIYPFPRSRLELCDSTYMQVGGQPGRGCVTETAARYLCLVLRLLYLEATIVLSF
jgi:hypothetical protein